MTSENNLDPFTSNLRARIEEGRRRMFGGNNDFFGNDVFDRFDPRGGGRGRSGSPFRDAGPSSAETSDRLRRERSPLFTSSSPSSQMPSSSNYDDSDDDFFRPGSNSPFSNRFSSRFPQQPQQQQQQQFQRESSPGVEHVIPIHIETTPEHKKKTEEEARNNLQQKKKNVISATPIPLPMETQPQSPLLQRQESVLRTYPGDSHVAIPLPPPDEMEVAMETTPPEPPTRNVQRSSKSPEKATKDATPPPLTTFGGKQTKEEKKPPIVVKEIPIQVQSQEQRRGTPPPPPNPKPKKKEEEQQQQSSQEEEQPQQQQPHPPQKKQKKPALDLVGDVMGKVGELETQISTHPPFTNGRKDKEYLFLDEMLTRTLIELDLIETEGREDVRLKRKECIGMIQGVIKLLECKVDVDGGGH